MSSSKPLYRSLPAQSIANVGSLYQEKKLDFQFRQKKDKNLEIVNFASAGILPCTMISGRLHVLLQQPKRGKKASSHRWSDLGGKKKDLAELPSDCAARKFTKYSYALFALKAPISEDAEEDEKEEHDHAKDSLEDLEALYPKTGGKVDALLMKKAEEWAKMWLLESGGTSFFNPRFGHHTFLLPVPFVSVDILAALSARVEGIAEVVGSEKRDFQWVAADLIASGPTAARLSSQGLFACLSGGSGGGLADMLREWRKTPQRPQPCALTVKRWGERWREPAPVVEVEFVKEEEETQEIAAEEAAGQEEEEEAAVQEEE